MRLIVAAQATVNRALSTLRGAINWARFQEPPLLATSPFHRFGITIRTKDETKRDRRVGAVEEKALLDAALAIESEEHAWAGASMHDRIIGALETCCRRGEMLRIRNRHVDWELHQIAIPGAHAKDGENRRVPFDPHGRLSAVLKRRAALGPAAGGPAGSREGQPSRSNAQRCRRSAKAGAPGRARTCDPRLRRLDRSGQRRGRPRKTGVCCTAACPNEALQGGHPRAACTFLQGVTADLTSTAGQVSTYDKVSFVIRYAVSARWL